VAVAGGSWSMRVEKMPDDNSCLFHAVRFLLDPASSSSKLRGAVVDAVRANPGEFSVSQRVPTTGPLFLFLFLFWVCSNAGLSLQSIQRARWF
jgi:hypothetical protein